MTQLVLPFTFTNDTLADANQVNANLAAIQTVLNGQVDDANIKPGANIAKTKLNLLGQITDFDVSPFAAIAKTKLNLLGQLTNFDVSPAAAISYSKLNLTGQVKRADQVYAPTTGLATGLGGATTTGTVNAAWAGARTTFDLVPGGTALIIAGMVVGNVSSVNAELVVSLGGVLASSEYRQGAPAGSAYTGGTYRMSPVVTGFVWNTTATNQTYAPQIFMFNSISGGLDLLTRANSGWIGWVAV